MRCSLAVLLLAAGVLAVQASSGRSLLQGSPTCPIKDCRDAASCIFNSVSRKWSCKACTAPLVPNSNKTMCTCPIGKYRTSNNQCSDCSRSYYCPGNGAGRVPCGNGLVTNKTGATSANSCYAPPGYAYVKTTSGAKAVPCGDNEYSSTFNRQPTCNKCISGLVTNPDNAAGTHTSAAVCVTGPGMYLLGSTAVPCPKGEFSDAYGMNSGCTPCEAIFGQGVTTAATGSTSKADCKWSEAGYALVDTKGKVVLGALGTTQIVGGARPCPQSYYCPGGDPTVAASQPTKCATDLTIAGRLWTEGEGASSIEDCVAPPGYRMDGSTVTECASGTYKDTWDKTTTCTSCGTGLWVSAKRSWITATDAYGQAQKQFKVRGSAESCFIQPGMGASMKHDSDGNVVMEAMLCPATYFGVAANKYGVVATPCQACPANTRTGFTTSAAQYKAATYFTSSDDVDGNTKTGSTDVAGGLSRNGYYDVAACYTKPGYGYYSGAASICPRGYYNAGDNRDPCTKCPNGKSTFFEGSTSAADCIAYAPGYGKVGTAPAMCYTGTYNDGTNEVCLPCPLGTTTDVSGATIDTATVGNPAETYCKLCSPGYGGASAAACQADAATAATKLCQDGFYGSASRSGSDTACAACPTGRKFTYTYSSEEVFLPGSTSRYGANSVDDCIADFSQTIDGPSYLPLATLTAEADIVSLRGCVDACQADNACAAAHFAYYVPQASGSGNAETACYLWKPSTTGAAKTGIALKTMASTANSQSVQAQDMGTGIWTFWTNTGTSVGDTKVTTVDVTESLGATVTLAECLKRCASDSQCAGVNYAGLATADDPDSVITACAKIMTKTTASAGLRTLIKADYKKFSPSTFCPAGQAADMSLTSLACAACTGETIKAMAGFAKCVACPTGTYATADHTQCKPKAFCPPGKTVDGITGDVALRSDGCIACTGDSYKAAAGPDACDTCATTGGVNDIFTKCATTIATCTAPQLTDPADKSQCYIP